MFFIQSTIVNNSTTPNSSITNTTPYKSIRISSICFLFLEISFFIGLIIGLLILRTKINTQIKENNRNSQNNFNNIFVNIIKSIMLNFFHLMFKYPLFVFLSLQILFFIPTTIWNIVLLVRAFKNKSIHNVVHNIYYILNIILLFYNLIVLSIIIYSFYKLIKF